MVHPILSTKVVWAKIELLGPFPVKGNTELWGEGLGGRGVLGEHPQNPPLCSITIIISTTITTLGCLVSKYIALCARVWTEVAALYRAG